VKRELVTWGVAFLIVSAGRVITDTFHTDTGVTFTVGTVAGILMVAWFQQRRSVRATEL
jgi:hypothetical protein